MGANHVFNKILFEIENSRLNYMINRRTPFSASISLKSSFIKFFDYESTAESQETLLERVKILEIENSELKARNEELVSIVDQQN